MSNPNRPITFSVFGLLAGAVALVLVTAIIVAALAAARADHRLNSVISRLEAVTAQIEEIQASNDQAEVSSEKARTHINDQNAELQHRITVLTMLLRKNGLKVPAETPSPASGTDAPKAPGGQSPRPPHPSPSPRRSPGSPAPTATNPSGPTQPSDPCVLLPTLCPLVKE